MIFATVTGRLTKDAEIRQAGNDSVCAISIASNKKGRNGESVATFIDASMWGKRGEAVVQYLKKGKSVTVIGELSTREHNGKTYLSLKVSELDFSSDSREAGGSRQPPPRSTGGGGGYDDDTFNKPSGADDEIPFASNVTNEPAERWWRFE